MMVRSSLLIMGKCTFNSFGAIGLQLQDCVAGQDRMCDVSYRSINRSLLSSPHVAGVAAAILTSPDTDVGFVGLAGGTLVRYIGAVVVVIVC